MRQFKVYKNLTLGYNFAIFALCLVISSSLAFAETNEVIERRGAPTQERQDYEARQQKQQECQTNQDHLNSQLDALKSACAGTKQSAGACIEDVLTCHEGYGSDDTCEELDKLSSSNSRNEVDEKIDRLKERRDKLVDNKDEFDEEINDLKSEMSDLDEDKLDLDKKMKEAQKELKKELNKHKTEASEKAKSIQQQVEDLQNQIEKSHQETIKDELALSDLIVESRLKCNNRGQEYSNMFVSRMRECMVKNGGRCSINQESIMNLGHKSLNDLGKAKKKSFVRKCMRISNNTEFGLRYKQLKHRIEVKKHLIRKQRSRFFKKKAKLKAQIQVISSESNAKDSESLLEKAQTDNTLAQEESLLLQKKQLKASQIREKSEKIENLKEKIDDYNDKIKDLEKKKAKSLSKTDLRKFKTALADVPDIIRAAEDLGDACECSPAARSIDGYLTDKSFCDSTSYSAPEATTNNNLTDLNLTTE